MTTRGIGLGDGGAALRFAIDLYLGNFDLMIEAPTPAITRRTHESFLSLQDAVGRHAPWARGELGPVLAVHAQVSAALAGDAFQLRRLQAAHTLAVDALRDLVAHSGWPAN